MLASLSTCSPMSAELPVIDKVFAYVTRGDSLLVFEHPEHPEVGVQVPAGTLRANETPAEGAMREALEETALTQLELVEFLGTRDFDMRGFGKQQLHRRHFYWIVTAERTPPRWRTVEQDASDGSGEHIFELYWAPLADMPELEAEHDAMIPELIARMTARAR